MLNIYSAKLLKFLQESNETLKAGMFTFAPYVMECWENTEYECDSPGLSVELLNELCNFLSIKCQLVAVNHSMFGDNLSGQWRGIMRQVNKQKLKIYLANMVKQHKIFRL